MLWKSLIRRKSGPSDVCRMSRIFAISDIHVDHEVNRKWVQDLDDQIYTEDVLLLAGDVTDSMDLLRSTLDSLKSKFKEVFFVPGNHELWVRDKSGGQTSVDKFHSILELCQSAGVHTGPRKVGVSGGGHAWIVPLFSWYATPEEDVEDSLYVLGPGASEDPSVNALWMDNHMCRWPAGMGSRSRHFGRLNGDRVRPAYDAPVVSFSHFLPRVDLIRAGPEDEAAVGQERRKLGLPSATPHRQGAMAGFNFTRYAGCRTLEGQLRALGSRVHVFGHQHRNRDRVVEGVRYVSHCLGYKRERDQGLTYGISHWEGPKQVWPEP